MKSNLDMRDRWDLNPRSSGLAATSVGARCPILAVLASYAAVRMRSRLRSLAAKDFLGIKTNFVGSTIFNRRK